jgi:hypothetical protein
VKETELQVAATKDLSRRMSNVVSGLHIDIRMLTSAIATSLAKSH